MLAHVLVHGEHDQLENTHEHQLHVGRLAEQSAHGYQRGGHCNVRAQQAESGPMLWLIDTRVINRLLVASKTGDQYS